VVAAGGLILLTTERMEEHEQVHEHGRERGHGRQEAGSGSPRAAEPAARDAVAADAGHDAVDTGDAVYDAGRPSAYGAGRPSAESIPAGVYGVGSCGAWLWYGGPGLPVPVPERDRPRAVRS
jgi:hypothetical protein